jgi:surface carbohydrate biosynthesis protein
MPKPLLILPIEERNRELDSRVLVALNAIAAGFEVIVGQQWEIFARLAELPASIILFKGNNAVQAAHMVAAKRAGHFVCSIEEEVLAVSNDREVLRCYHATARPALDLIFAQGTRQAALLGDHWPEAKDRIATVGNPRADLLHAARDHTRGEDDLTEVVRALRSRYGSFVLFNTNLASINPRIDDIYGYFELCVRVGVMDPRDRDDMKLLHQQFLWEREIFFAMTTLAMHLAADGVPVVMRPHPSENAEIWQRHLAGIPGLEVIREGSQVDWLKASALLVHSGCTTGLEAFLLGHPVAALTPGQFGFHDFFISNLVSTNFSSVNAARRAIHDHLAGARRLDKDRDAKHASLEPFLHIPSGETAAERIVKSLAAVSDIAAPETTHLAGLFAGARSHLSDRRLSKAGFDRDDIMAAIRTCSRLAPTVATPRVTELGPLIVHLSARPDESIDHV